MDFVPDDRALFAPSLTWRPSAATSLTLQMTWQENRSGSTAQFFPRSGMVLPNPNGRIPVNRFIGEPGFDRYDSERSELGWLFEHRLNDRWTLRQNTRLADNSVDYRTIYGDAFSNPTDPFVIGSNQRVLNRIAYVDKRDNRVLAADQHVEGRFETGAVHHQLLAGLDFIRFREDSQTFAGAAPAIDIYSPVYTGFAQPTLAEVPRTRLRQTGIYLQDQMKIGRWIAVAGLRHDQSVNGQEGEEDEKDDAVSRRAALMYQLGNGLSPYISYSESFTPVPGTNLAGQRFEPQRGEQLEAGFKWEPAGRRIAFNASVYELREEKRLKEISPGVTGQVGKTVTRGVELEAVGRLLPQLDIAAHYNYIDIDAQLEELPKHQVGVWGSYRFALGKVDGLRAGLGVRYLSSFRDNEAPETPSATLLDAMLGLDDGPWRYQLNVQNLTDRIYVATCLGDGRGDCWFGARRNVIAAATYRF